MVALELNFLGYGFYKDNHIQENLTHKKSVHYERTNQSISQ